MSRINREVNMYENIVPNRKYTLTTKQLQYLVDRSANITFHEGEGYILKNKRICPGRYEVWLEIRK